MSFIMDHPLVHHKIALLRAESTGKKLFRELAREITILLTYEATRNLPLITKKVWTPLMETDVLQLPETAIAIIPILRAGLGMSDALQDLIPIAKVGHLGLYRDETTLQPVEYYKKFPVDISSRHVFVVDPMLATGGSLSAALEIVEKLNPPSITVLSIIASPEGLALIERKHPNVNVFIAQMDEKLNENGYILPGLGDAGDRLFGTK